MIITVASGKGGTGKTTVAVSLASSLAVDQESGNPANPLFLDCDVEEPNAALFLNPVIQERREVGQMIPVVDLEKCTCCGRCAEVCQYHAIAVVGERVLVFAELCHGCGSCTLNCPTEAIREVLHVTGTIERGWTLRLLSGHAGPVEFAQGTMNVGEPMAVPIIRQLRQWVIPTEPSDRPIILDASPGTACPVVESMRGVDFVLMVTEPTPFGLHDLRLAVEVARDELGLPVGVVINRDGVGDQGVEDYCAAESIPILMRIPLEKRVAEAYSEGMPLVDALPMYRTHFVALWERLEELVHHKKANRMKVTIDQEECIECGVCCADCPEVFEEDDMNGTSRIVEAYRVRGDPAVGQVPDEMAECVRAAADGCPVEAIHIEE
jgi:MinD superfamily P-loop ATPase